LADKQSLKFFRDIFLPIGIIIGVTLLVTHYRDEVTAFAEYGYLGVFAACFAANATVFLPAPSSAIVFAFASIYSPLWVAVAGGLGAAGGELLGYAAGYSGRRAIEATAIGKRIEAWFSKNAVLTVFILALLPLPLFDIVGILAGSSKMKLGLFLPAVIAGKILKMTVYAILGANLIPALTPLLQNALD